MLKRPENLGVIHFIGIGGIGMSGIAEILVQSGYLVQGSDIKASNNTKRLEKLGIEVFIGQRKSNILNAKIIVVSTAISKNNIELIEAKKIFLQIIDFSWRSHLQYLEQLRQVIGLRSYGQRDPLIEYKKEAFNLFSNLLEKLKLDYVTILMNLKVITEEKSSNEERVNSKPQTKKMGRNEPCFCGSGKKFKHCHGAL